MSPASRAQTPESQVGYEPPRSHGLRSEVYSFQLAIMHGRRCSLMEGLDLGFSDGAVINFMLPLAVY